MLTRDMLKRAGLTYDDPITASGYTADPSGELEPDIERKINGHDDYWKKPVITYKQQLRKLIVTDWSLISNNSVNETDELFNLLFQHGFEIYLWTGELKKVSSVSEYIATKKKIIPCHPKIVHDTALLMDVPIHVKESVLLDYFKIRQLVALMKGKENVLSVLDADEVLEYLQIDSHDETETNQEQIQLINAIILSLADKEEIMVDMAFNDYEQPCLKFVFELMNAYPEKVRILNYLINNLGFDEIEQEFRDIPAVARCLESATVVFGHGEDEDKKIIALLAKCEQLKEIKIEVKVEPTQKIIQSLNSMASLITELSLADDIEQLVFTESQFPSLRYLKIKESSIRPAQLSCLTANHPQLTHIQITKCDNISGEDLVQALQHCPQLRDFDGGSYSFTSQQLDQLLTNCRVLTSLKVDLSELSKLNNEHHSLNYFELRQTSIKLSHLFGIISAIPSLRVLNLKAKQITSDEKINKKIKNVILPHVTSLKIENAKLHARQLIVLLNSMPELINLTLNQCDVAGMGHKTFVSLKKNKIKELKLEYTKISTNALESLIKHSIHLEALELNANKRTWWYEIPAELVTYLVNERVPFKRATFFHTKITIRELAHLFDYCRFLQVVDFDNSSIVETAGNENKISQLMLLMKKPTIRYCKLPDGFETKLKTAEKKQAVMTNVLPQLLSDTTWRNPTLNVQEYIIPKIVSNRKFPQVSDYRENLYFIKGIADGKLIIEEIMPDDIKIYNEYKKYTNPLEIYKAEFESTPDIFYAPNREYVLDQRRWYKLISVSYYEKLLYLNDVDVLVGHSQKTGLYYIMPMQPSPQPIMVAHIFESKIHSLSDNIATPENAAEIIQSLTFMQNNSSDFDLASYLYHIDLTMAEPLENLATQAPEIITAAFRDYYRGRPNQPGFKAGKLQGTFANDLELASAIKTQKLGSCIQRAISCQMDLNLFGISSWISCNQIHGRLEVMINNICYRVDLGGYPVTLNVTPLALPKEDEMEIDDAKQPALAIVSPLKPEHISIDNPFNTWRNKLSEKQILPIELYVESLLDKIKDIDSAKRNVLLVCDSNEQIEALNAMLIRYVQIKLERHYYYLSHYSKLIRKILILDAGSYKKIASPLVEMMKDAREGDVFFADISDISKAYLWYSRLIEKERYFDTMPISTPLTIIMAVEKQALADVGSELRPLFGLIETVPTFLPCDLYQGHLIDNEAAENITTIAPIKLYENVNAQQQLTRKIEVDGRKLYQTEGTLITAIKNNAPGIILENAPWHLRSFTTFIIDVTNKREVFYNDERLELPEYFRIYDVRTPYSFDPAVYSHEPLNDNNQMMWQYTLNVNTYNLFFKAYRCKKDQTLKLQPGWLAQYAGRHLTVLVTDTLAENAWAELIDEAKKVETQLHFIVPEDILLPSKMTNKQASTATAEVAIEKEKEKGKEKIRNDYKVKLITANDVDFVFEHRISTQPSDFIFHVTEATSYRDLIEYLSPVAKSDDELLFTSQPGAVLNQLSLGKRVILKGRFSKELAHRLETLFSATPYLWVNGKQKELKGELVIITDQPESLRYFNPEQINITQKIYWSELSQQFGDELVQKIQAVCEAIYQNTTIRFSYIQLKTMLNQLQCEPHCNPLRSFLELEAQAEQALKIGRIYFPHQKRHNPQKKFKFRRIGKIISVFAYCPYAFVAGISGTGKTTFILNYIKKYYQKFHQQEIEVFVGLKKIMEWLEKGGILFLDEANLEADGVFDIFENMFGPHPSITVNGVTYPLTDKHKVIFAGNFSHYAHRQQHQLFKRHGGVVVFKELPDAFLAKTVILPVFKNAFPQSESIVEMLRRTIPVLLKKYKFVNQQLSRHPLTPRNLQMMALRIINHLHDHDRLNVPFEVLVNLAIKDEIRGCTTKAERKLLKCFSMEEEQAIKQYKRDLHNLLSYQLKDYTVTKSRMPTLRLLHDLLALRTLRTEVPALNKYGMYGLLLEGDAATGKKSLFKEILHSQQFVNGDEIEDEADPRPRYYHITSTDPDVVKATLKRAFHEGAVVQIDKLNTLDFLENCLNAYLSGYDLKGRPPAKSGFLVLAKQNSKNSAANTLSPAARKRFFEENVNDYKREELLHILESKGYDNSELAKSVDDFLSAQQLADFENTQWRPNLHHLLAHHTARTQSKGKEKEYEHHTKKRKMVHVKGSP